MRSTTSTAKDIRQVEFMGRSTLSALIFHTTTIQHHNAMALKKISLSEYLENNTTVLKNDDWNRLEEQMNDAIWVKNLDYYLECYLESNGIDLNDFLNHHNTTTQ